MRSSTSTAIIEPIETPTEPSETPSSPLESELEHCLAEGIRTGRFPAQWTSRDFYRYLIGRIIVRAQSNNGPIPDPVIT